MLVIITHFNLNYQVLTDIICNVLEDMDLSYFRIFLEQTLGRTSLQEESLTTGMTYLRK